MLRRELNRKFRHPAFAVDVPKGVAPEFYITEGVIARVHGLNQFVVESLKYFVRDVLSVENPRVFPDIVVKEIGRAFAY